MSEAARIETRTDALQRLASDPARSAWVSANAGSGKTEVLVRRVIRLMLDGARPDEILCLTYTKAAAAVMTNRVFERLADWIALDEEELKASVARLTGKNPGEPTLRRARELFADALETPGGLKIQTIHAFCERLLHLFPFGADAPAHFEVLDGAAQAELLEEAIAAVIAGTSYEARDTPDHPPLEGEGRRREATPGWGDPAQVSPHPDPRRSARIDPPPQGEGGAERNEIAEALAFVAEDTFDEEFRALLQKLLTARAGTADAAAAADIRAAQIAGLAKALHVAEDDTAKELTRDFFAHEFWRDGCKAVVAALRNHINQTNDGTGALIGKVLGEAEPARQCDLLRDVFLGSKGDALKPNSYMTKKARDAFPAEAAALDAEAARFQTLLDRLSALETLARNRALFTVADAVLAHYRAAKARRGALDFADLIDKTRALLANPGIGPWILYKLDSGLSHILVDEAQDTSDAQWDIIRALAEEFTAGEGARALRRTTFAVGDEKQSIYGFQGAAPKSFARMRDHFKRAHEDAGRAFEPVNLRVSFRSTPEVLGAVDRIFSTADRVRGLSFDDSGALIHESTRLDADDIGFVELWPLIGKIDAPEIDNALDPDEGAAASGAAAPALRLAERVAKNIRLLIADGDPAGRQVAPGDIMVLVRRRGALFEALIAALKAAGVAVAGADRLDVARHIAVRDCLALGRAALAPDDDYALACALKSPLVGLDDDHLLRFAPERPGLLIEALRMAADRDGGELAGARDFIERWRDRVALGPFDFFARLLDSEEGRRRLVARLGAEASDALDEFLDRALDFERREGASLASFLAAFETTEIEIKRDLDQGADEVRVMTVHAAKGLEAPIVILPDTTGAPGGGRPPPLVRVEAAGAQPLDVWTPAGARSEAIDRARARLRGETEDEHRRLLYVALTRAKNGLILAGATGEKNLRANSWYAQISAALAEGDVRPEEDRRGPRTRLVSLQARDGDGEVSFFVHEGRDLAGAAAQRASPDPVPAHLLPGWASGLAPAEGVRQPPLSPSRAADAADRRDRPFDRPGAAAARARGRLAHRLLEALPGVAPGRREAAAAALAARTAAGLDPDERSELVGRVLVVLADPALAALYGPDSRAEVAIAGPVALADGMVAHATGIIDRLAVAGDEVLIADYKTGARPPARPESIPDRIIAQLALYRALVQPLYPGRRVRCIVIWTAGPLAHELTDAALDAALAHVTPA